MKLVLSIGPARWWKHRIRDKGVWSRTGEGCSIKLCQICHFMWKNKVNNSSLKIYKERIKNRRLYCNGGDNRVWWNQKFSIFSHYQYYFDCKWMWLKYLSTTCFSLMRLAEKCVLHHKRKDHSLLIIIRGNAYSIFSLWNKSNPTLVG